VLSGFLVEGAGPDQAPEVRVFDATTGKALYHFLAYPDRMRSGVRVAVGDVNGDGTLDIVTAPGPFGPSLVFQPAFRAAVTLRMYSTSLAL
jgi:FG-GAP repeat